MFDSVLSLAARPGIRKGALAILLAVSATAVGVGLIPPRAAEALANKAQAVAAMLGARSPGSRTVAELTKIKPEGAPTGAPSGIPPESPEERALGKIFPPQPESAGPPGTVPLILPLYESLAERPLALVFAPPAAGVGIGGGSLPPPAPGGAILLPPGGVAPTAPPTVTAPPVVTPEVPAVPEPATWAILLVGFAMCGAALRRPRTSAGHGTCRAYP